MGKPRVYGMQNACVPNARADMRRGKTVYRRFRERPQRDAPADKREQRDRSKEQKRIYRGSDSYGVDHEAGISENGER